MNKTLITLLISLIMCSYTYGHDFSVTINKQKIYLNIKSTKDHLAEVTYNGTAIDMKPSSLQGELKIPSKIKHNNVIYTIIGIDAKAFSKATGLTSIILPSTIKYIDDFAFEGCTSLENIVFPGNNVKFGQGVFFNCISIKNISIGSDWTNINLMMFRWSDSLKTISIPAKIEKIQNMKALISLENITVDKNNPNFCSIDGILYNKSAETLYGCPRAYKSPIIVAPNTKIISNGAFIDCINTKYVCISDSVYRLSFKEFSRMPLLEKIIFKNPQPISTAKQNGENVFLLQVSNPNVIIYVHKESLSTYKDVLVQKTGEYTEVNSTIPYYIEYTKMPKQKNIIGVNSFPQN